MGPLSTTGIGSGIPIIIVPAMHLSMYDHKIIQRNVGSCKNIGIKFIQPLMIGNKAKMADSNLIVSSVIREIGKKDLVKKKILIIGGSTAEPIDDVRVLSNRSSGKTAVWLAKNAFYRGADVELWYGHHQEPAPDYIKTVNFESISDLLKILKTKTIKNSDAIVVCAALADYLPCKETGKISSGKKDFVLNLSLAPKTISTLRKKAPDAKIIGFKVEVQKKNIKQKASDLLKRNNLDFVIANTTVGFSGDKNEIWIVDKTEHDVHKKGKKEQLTNNILDLLL